MNTRINWNKMIKAVSSSDKVVVAAGLVEAHKVCQRDLQAAAEARDFKAYRSAKNRNATICEQYYSLTGKML